MTDPTEAISVLNEAQSLIEALCQFKQKLAMLSKRLAEPQLNFVTLIEAAALERAAKVAEDYDVSRSDGYITRRDIAAAIRALSKSEAK